MADFSQAVAKTELWEGGYSNNPLDPGGETYRGISRRSWPNWVGWAVIDSLVGQPGFPVDEINDYLNRNSRLQGLVVDFYHKNFWNYDGIADQDVAWKVFDLGVNVGKVHAVKILQHAVGTNMDGVYGPNTERLVNSHPLGSLAPILRAAAEEYHKSIVWNCPKDEVFLAGWLRRDEA